MAQTPITVQLCAGSYAAANPVPAITFTAADTVNGNLFQLVAGDILLIWNSDGAVAHTFTLTSVPDFAGRTEDITAQSMAATTHCVFGPIKTPGWQQTDGSFHLTANSAMIMFAILRPGN